MASPRNSSLPSQFNYLNGEHPGQRLAGLQLASENLLKEIGVDVQMFLSQPYQKEILENKSDSYKFKLPSLSDLNQATTHPLTQYQHTNISSSGKVNRTATLDMKFRMMQMDRYEPTDEELELFNLNHLERMARIESRIHDQEQIKIQQAVKEEEESSQEVLFMKSSRVDFSSLEHEDGIQEDDLMVTDLSDEENDFKEPAKKGLEPSFVLVKKEKADMEGRDLSLVLPPQTTQSLLENDQDILKQVQVQKQNQHEQCDSEGEEDLDFISVEAILENPKEKVYSSPSKSNMHTLIISSSDTLQFIEDNQDREKYSQFMSWSSVEPNTQNISIAKEKSGQTDYHNLNTFSDPFQVNQQREVEEDLNQFKYNEQTSQSEDEEAQEL